MQGAEYTQYMDREKRQGPWPMRINEMADNEQQCEGRTTDQNGGESTSTSGRPKQFSTHGHGHLRATIAQKTRGAALSLPHTAFASLSLPSSPAACGCAQIYETGRE